MTLPQSHRFELRSVFEADAPVRVGGAGGVRRDLRPLVSPDSVFSPKAQHPGPGDTSAFRTFTLKVCQGD